MFCAILFCLVYKIIMKICRILAVILIYVSSCETIWSVPANAVYLNDQDSFSRVEKVEYNDEPRLYIRTMKKGAFLSEQESNNLVDAIYFDRIRKESPRSAAFSSLLMFDAGSEYVWYRWNQNQALQFNSQARILKLATLAVTVLSYYATNRSAADIARNPYTTSSSAKRQFELMRNIYYASAMTTLGVYSYFTYNAYNGFGHDVDGNDLRIQQRQELPADHIPALNENVTGGFHFSFTARFGY